MTWQAFMKLYEEAVLIGDTGKSDFICYLTPSKILILLTLFCENIFHVSGFKNPRVSSVLQTT